jgi:hypothetical protein
MQQTNMFASLFVTDKWVSHQLHWIGDTFCEAPGSFPLKKVGLGRIRGLKRHITVLCVCGLIAEAISVFARHRSVSGFQRIPSPANDWRQTQSVQRYWVKAWVRVCDGQVMLLNTKVTTFTRVRSRRTEGVGLSCQDGESWLQLHLSPVSMQRRQPIKESRHPSQKGTCATNPTVLWSKNRVQKQGKGLDMSRRGLSIHFEGRWLNVRAGKVELKHLDLAHSTRISKIFLWDKSANSTNFWWFYTKSLKLSRACGVQVDWKVLVVSHMGLTSYPHTTPIPQR